MLLKTLNQKLYTQEILNFCFMVCILNYSLLGDTYCTAALILISLDKNIFPKAAVVRNHLNDYVTCKILAPIVALMSEVHLFLFFMARQT